MSGNTKNWWLVTIKKCLTGYTHPGVLAVILRNLRKRIRGADWISRVSFELDSHDILHIHTMFRRSTEIKYGMYQVPGFTVRFDKVTPGTFKTVYSYICKDSYNKYMQEQIMFQNYYRNNYGFTHDCPSAQEIVPII